MKGSVCLNISVIWVGCDYGNVKFIHYIGNLTVKRVFKEKIGVFYFVYKALFFKLLSGFFFESNPILLNSNLCLCFFKLLLLI